MDVASFFSRKQSKYAFQKAFFVMNKLGNTYMSKISKYVYLNIVRSVAIEMQVKHPQTV